MRSILNYANKPEDEAVTMQSLIADSERDIPKREDFKNMWLRDPIVRHGIRMNTDLITAGMVIKSDKTKIENDLLAINFNSPWTTVIDKITRDAQIFGTTYTEFMYSSNNGKVMGLWNMDPIRVDFERDQNGNVMLKPDTTVTKYIEEIPYGRGETGGERDMFGRTGRFFSTDKVSHFSFEQFPGTIDGISRLHSGYELIKDFWGAQDGVVEAIKRFGKPIYKVTAGDDKYRINPEGMKKIKKQLSGINRKSAIIIPSWQNLELLHPDGISKISDNLKYFLDIIPISLGIPKALILETGESTNRATLRQQIRLYISRLEKDRERLVNYLLNVVFKKIGEVNGWGDDLPEIIYPPITLDDVESYAKRMGTYVKEGILSPETVKKKTLQIERLEEVEQEEPEVPEDDGFAPPEESEEIPQDTEESDEPLPEEGGEEEKPEEDGEEKWKEE